MIVYKNLSKALSIFNVSLILLSIAFISASSAFNQVNTLFIQEALAATDVSPPTVTIKSPVAGASLPVGSLSVSGVATDGTGGSGIKGAWVRIDNGVYTAVTPRAPGDWSTWSTTISSTAGSHTLTAKATDNAGNSNWNTISITISTSSSDDDIPSALRTIQVTSINALMTAISAAKPGDHIILANGIYDTTQWLLDHSAKYMTIRIKGTEVAPIVITAATIGGVELKGAGGFRVYDSAYVIIQGFKFTHSQDNARYTDDMAIQCKYCSHVRFTRNTFALTTSSSSMADWLGITSKDSSYNIVDHNTFMNKKTKGVFMFIFGSDGQLSKHNKIDHNYFYNQYYSSGNGGECIRVGNSELGLQSAYTSIQYNLFEKCSGDMEAVTIKASDNSIIYNTFRNNEGSLTLRHGNRNLVEGNFFLYGENGVRVYGHDHKIINNYFEGDYGTGTLNTMVIGSGTVATDLTYSNSQHSQPRGIVVAFNTFVKNKSNLVVGEDFRPLPPTDITIAYNIIQGDSGTLVTYEDGDNVNWQGNILYGLAKKGNMPTAGYTSVDPQLLLGSDSVYRIKSTSPAIDKAASSSFPFVIKDMDVQSRSLKLDTGSDEYSTASVARHPLAVSNVGPGAP